MTHRRWVSALSALALAFPATALGAHTGGTRSHATPATSGRLGRALLLGLGSGYYSRHGSPHVRVIQRRLALAGYTPGPIDGRFGSMTWRAVVAFQAARGLQVDGIVGPQTRDALTQSSVVLSPGAGDRPAGSERVRVLQRRLARAGYAPGPIDGHYGLLTERAVRRFQAAHGFRVDGVAGPHTLARVGEPARSVHRSQRQPRVPASPPAHGRGRPGQSPARPGVALPGVAPPNHRGSAPFTGGLLILCALGLALILTAWLYSRRRSSNRISPIPLAAVNGNEPAALVRNTNLVEPFSHHAATVETNMTPVATSNAPVATNGTSNGAGKPNPGAAPNGRGAPPNGRGAAIEQSGAPLDGEAAYRRADRHGDAAGAFNLGVLLEERGAIDEAEAAYRRAVQRGHGAAASNLGVLLEERGASIEAEAAYRRADRDGDATGAFNLGVLLEERGAMAEAEAAYRRAVKRGRGEIANIARAALLDFRGGRQESTAGLGTSGHDDA
jgi:peptidoglycan hydrolase-like protein with peptidoglycan-binding domain